MKNYIGTKLIQAEPQLLEEDRGEYKKGEPGFKVVYPDGYTSWSPNNAFKKAYMEIEQPDKITEQDVARFFSLTETVKMGEKTTVCRFTCKNGFEIIESSSCVDPDNYDENIGVQICIRQAKEKVWLILGSLLQFGLDPAIATADELMELHNNEMAKENTKKTA